MPWYLFSYLLLMIEQMLDAVQNTGSIPTTFTDQGPEPATMHMNSPIECNEIFTCTQCLGITVHRLVFIDTHFVSLLYMDSYSTTCVLSS